MFLVGVNWHPIEKTISFSRDKCSKDLDNYGNVVCIELFGKYEQKIKKQLN